MENKKDVFYVIDENGNKREAEVIAIFQLEDGGKNYIIYTYNENNEHNMVKIYTSVLVEKDGGYSFEKIETEDEWEKIKEILKQVGKEA